jgi:hypothetical protein
MAVLLLAGVMGMLSSGCVGVAPGNDAVVVRAEQTAQASFDLFDNFLKWEYANRAAAPQEVRAFGNRLRQEGPVAIRTLRLVTQTYKSNRTPENKASVESAMKALERLKEEVAKYFGSKPQTGIQGWRGQAAAAVPPGLVLAGIDGVIRLLAFLNGLIAQAKRTKEWTPEEEQVVDAKMKEAFRQAHWAVSQEGAATVPPPPGA